MGHEDSHELYIRNDLFIRRLNTVLPDLLSDTSPSTLTRVELLDVNEYKEEPLKKDDMYGLKAFDIDRKLISWIRHFSLPPESYDEHTRSRTVVGLKRHGIVVDWTSVTTKQSPTPITSYFGLQFDNTRRSIVINFRKNTLEVNTAIKTPTGPDIKRHTIMLSKGYVEEELYQSQLAFSKEPIVHDIDVAKKGIVTILYSLPGESDARVLFLPKNMRFVNVAPDLSEFDLAAFLDKPVVMPRYPNFPNLYRS